MNTLNLFRMLVAAVAAGLSAATVTATVTSVPVKFYGGGSPAAYSDDGLGYSQAWVEISVDGLESFPGAADGAKTIEGRATYPSPLACATAAGQLQDTVRLEPGKLYTVAFGSAVANLVTMGLIAPPGYRIEINGVLRDSYSQTVDIAADPMASRYGAVTVRLVPEGGDFHAPAGTPTALGDGKIFWQVALGSLYNGDSAGAIALIDPGTGSNWNSLFTPAALHYQPPTRDEAVVTVHPHPDIGGPIRQVLTPGAAINILTHADNPTKVPVSGQMLIEFYHRSRAPDTGTFPRTFSGHPFVTYLVKPGGTATSLEIVRTTYDVNNLDATSLSAARTTSTALARTGTWPTFTWTVDEWHSGSTAVARRVVQSGGTTNSRTETRQVREVDTNNTVVQTTSYSFAQKGWGEELTEIKVGTTDNPTKRDYYEVSTEYGRYGFLKSSKRDNGSEVGAWEAYDYYTSSTPSTQNGRVKHRFRPFGNLPASPSFLTNQGEVTTFTYSNDAFGAQTRPATVETQVNGVTVSKSEITYTSQAYSGSSTLFIVTAQRKDYTSGSSFLSSETKYFQEDAGVRPPNAQGNPVPSETFFRKRIYSSVQPDGVKRSYVHQRGTFYPETKQFTASSSGKGSRVAELLGAKNSGTNLTQRTSEYGFVIDPIYLLTEKSTMSVSIRDERALLVRTESHAWTGSTWALVGSVDYTYDFCGRLTKRKDSTGAEQSWTWTGEWQDTQTGADGVVVTFTPDAGGRIETATKSAGGPLDYDVSTTYVYDAAGQVLSEAVFSSKPDSETIITNRSYDDAGRLKSVQPAGLGTTQISYSPTGLTQTTTAPDLGEKVVGMHRDGRLASVTGSAVVSEYYSYSIETDGRRLTQVTSGTSSSPRWTKSWVDWIGRPVKSERPGFSKSSQSSFIEENFYDDATIGPGRLYKTTRTGFLSTRYEYDVLGALFRSGMDVLNNGLVPASSDRITETSTRFELIGSDWWLRSESWIYPTVDSATKVPTGYSLTQLTGLGGTIQARTKTFDAENNETTTTVSVDRTNKEVTTTTVGPLGTSTAKAENGLATETTGFDGLTAKAAYDALGRPWKSIDTRNKATVTSYYEDTPLVYSVTDAANHTIATYSYDLMGRISVTENAGVGTAKGITRYSYNLRGQLLRQWGTGAYPLQYGYNTVYGDRESLTTYQDGDDWGQEGWPSETGDPEKTSTTTWSFDEASGLLWKKIDAHNKAVVFNYNVRGQVATRTWARGVVTNYTYFGDPSDTSGQPPTGELKRIHYTFDPNQTPDVNFTYNRLGQMDAVIDHMGTWDYVYDVAKPWRQSATGLPAYYGTRTWTPLYDSTTGVKGRYRGFQLGSAVGSNADLEQIYSYNSAGYLSALETKRLSNTHTRTFRYGYSYEEPNPTSDQMVPWVSSVSIDGGHAFTVTRTYDVNRPLLASIETKWNTTSQVRYDYGHNALRQRAYAQLSGSVFSDYYSDYTPTSDKAVTRYFSYNTRGELETETMHRKAAVATPSSNDELPGRRNEYRYDNLGNRKTAGQTGDASTGDEVYTPNKLNQYTQKENNTVRVTGTAVPGATVVVQGATSTNERDRAWAADIVPANSIKAVKGTANVYSVLLGQGAGGRDKFKLAGAGFFIPKALQAFEYDDDGNLKHDSVWDYYYDGENRLVAMEHRSEVMGGSALANADKRRMEFRYDYKGRRVRKTVYGGWNGAVFNATPLCDTKFLYDGWNLIAELDALSPSTLPLIRSYTWGLDLTGSLTASGGVGALLQIHDYAGAGKTLLPAYDGNGNVVALFDATSGAVEARYEYNAFGELIRSEGTYAQQNNFRFSTKFTDSESGLVYYGYRFYSPALGRFVNKDPLEESGGVNLYAFVSNRVVGGFDYLGLNGTVWVMDGSSGEGTPIDPQILAQEWLDQRNRDSRFNQFVNNSMARLMDFKGAGTALLYQRRLSGMPDSTRDWAAHFWHVNDWLTGFHRVAAQVEAFEQKIRAHADAAIRSGWASLSDGMMFSDGSIAGVSRGGEAAAVGLGGIYAKPPLRPDLSGWDRMTQASARTGPTLAAFTSGSIENLSIRTGASVNIVSVGSDATFSYAAKDGAIEGELTGTFGAPKGVSAIVFATVEGRVPLYNKNTDFSAGFLAAPLVAFGITVDFSKVPTALTQFFGWRYTPTGIRFNLGVGIGGSATVDSVDASTTLMKVEVKNDGTRTRSGVFDRKGP